MTLSQNLPTILCKNITFSWKKKENIFDNFSLFIDLTIESPLFILGPSGTGKTVFLKLLSGLLQPQEGIIELNNQALLPSQLSTQYGYIYVPGSPALIGAKKVWENMAIPLLLHTQEPLSSIKDRIYTMFTEFELPTEIWNKKAYEVSLSEKKILSLIRAQSLATTGLFLDEPTTYLDWHHRRHIYRHIQRLSQKSPPLPSILITHDMKGALLWARRILVLDRGKVLYHGDPKNIYQSQELLVQDFLRHSFIT